MTRIVLLVFLLGCFGEKPTTATRPTPPTIAPSERVDAAIARWATALQSGDERALRDATDGDGQFSIVYGAIKLAASHVDGGEQAVEETAVLLVLQALFPNWFGLPADTFHAVVPRGLKIGPALVDAGMAKPAGSGNTVVAVPRGQLLERIVTAEREHVTRLRANQAWTCKATEIERTLVPSEPALVRMAQVSQHQFASWLQRVERLWLVRGQCADGAPALFVITAFLDGSDRVLLATGPRLQ